MTPDPTPPSRIFTIRNVPCEQAGIAYSDAQATFFVQQQKLVKAKKQLHRVKAHGTAAQLQHAKNKVKRVKNKIKEYQDAMDAAIAHEVGGC